ncbi:sensor histidine kinase [Nonomuraea typhae]|uniref:sensor histidine kinase n=1 Tax=Nonomuraea typhae TaxID=2603600 RepID=UPI0012F8D028|nr:histidine kinase [Nonomuraea typhae]
MPGLLRSVWHEPRPSDPPRRGWRDWALVGVLAPAALLEGALRPDLPWLSMVITLALLPTLLWRRTRPLLMITLAFAVSTLLPLAADARPESYTMVYVLLVVYALFRWGSGRDAVIGMAVMLAGLTLSLALRRIPPADTLGAVAVLVSALTLGLAFRFRAGARMRELDQVKLLEREHLARDLHDTVAHHVSAMAIRAQAGLAASAAHPEAATDALRVIEAEAALALDEMRLMVRVLRQDQPADLAPGRRITDLQQLSGGDPAVDVTVSGNLDGLPPLVEAAVYRVAQESVTNARRHARRATRIEVRVEADDTSVRLRVADDGDPVAQTYPGFGLVGMRERAGLLGGTCVAGPGPDRGWTVTAVLPRTGSAP